MACFKPLMAVDFGICGDSDKHRIKILSSYDYSFSRAREKYGDSLMFLPCNKCVGCAQDYARAWQCRIMCEYESRRERKKEGSSYDTACFITLTYRDNAPLKPLKEDLRDFIKSIRNKFGKGISFFGCGELGSRTERSHYHIILFGVDFKDKKIISKRGTNYVYRSKTCEEIWNKGFCSIGSLTIKSAGYVSQYCDKKKISGFDDGSFVIMSRSLGKQFFIDHQKEIFNSDYLYFDGNKFKLPRIFLRWALNDEGFYLRCLAEDYNDRKRKVAQRFRYDRAHSFSIEEEAMHNQSWSLVRDKIEKEKLRDVY